MKQLGYFCIFLCLMNTPAFSEVAPQPDTSKNARHSIQLSPVGIISATLAANYEFLLMRRQGLFLEGSYTFPLFPNSRGYGVGIHYRFHFQPRMNSKYVGAFFRTVYIKSVIANAENRIITNHDYSLKLNVPGINYGWRSRFFKTRFNYDFRLGLGVPFVTLTWGKNGRPESISGVMSTSTFEKMLKYSSLLDFDFCIGYSL